ncbi:hypothetical protein D2T29_18280 [Sinirhodobacter populi]|uniref:Uncharacterized protein n=1 Tax=Paenirhodobacter populi TaxID=2306993 RepID=A0A443IKZ6_9RHOB|nr:hypothetical protein [Sinirhodobacter populi]RWR05409.1 hypothetical protein D2T33_19950 [Sinirhodobacter populi]RWR27657.1 hypothetical protein D2T29_18280 [Sinirhodobacter populi]
MNRHAKASPRPVMMGSLSSTFDPERPILDENGTSIGEDGRKVRAVSNVQDGDGPAWFLLEVC